MARLAPGEIELEEVIGMRTSAVEATWTMGHRTPISREAVHRVLDKSPDGYKLLARLVDDPCELLRDCEPGSGEGMGLASRGNGRSLRGKLQEQLREWLVAGLQQEMAASIG